MGRHRPQSFPLYVVTIRLGNPPEVARKHYLQATEDDYAEAVQNPAQQPAAQPRPKTEQGAVTGCGCDTLQNRPKSISGNDLDSVEAKRLELSTLALRTPRSPN